MTLIKHFISLLVLNSLAIDAVPEWQDLQCQVFYVWVKTFIILIVSAAA